VTKTICISGFFDPIHAGHIAYIRDAALYGDLIVILNSDAAAIRKKGYVFQSWDQRATIVRGMKGVKDVVHADDEDDTVCESLREIKPDFFANGGDRGVENTPELELCYKMGIEPIFNCGGNKTASSSEIVNNVRDA